MTNSRATGFSSAIKNWQTAVIAYFTSMQLLLFVFELHDSFIPSSIGILTAVQRQTAVTAYFTSRQLLLFVFELQDYLMSSSTALLSYCFLSLIWVIFFCHRVLAWWPPCKTNSSNCSLYKWAVTAVCLWAQNSILPSSTGIMTAVQRQPAVTAYFTSEQLLLFVFELQDYLLPSSTGIMTAVQRQTAVTDYMKSNQLLLFAQGIYTLISRWWDEHQSKVKVTMIRM